MRVSLVGDPLLGDVRSWPEGEGMAAGQGGCIRRETGYLGSMWRGCAECAEPPCEATLASGSSLRLVLEASQETLKCS